MAATAVKTGFGSTLKKGATAVAELKSISHAGHKLNFSDASNMDSPDGYEEFIAGLGSGGQFVCEGNYLNTGGQATLLTDLQAKTKASWAVVMGPPGSPVVTITADCYVESLEPSAKYNEPLAFSATLKITGKPVYS